jgi:hypothetical protein
MQRKPVSAFSAVIEASSCDVLMLRAPTLAALGRRAEALHPAVPRATARRADRAARNRFTIR